MLWVWPELLGDGGLPNTSCFETTRMAEVPSPSSPDLRCSHVKKKARDHQFVSDVIAKKSSDWTDPGQKELSQLILQYGPEPLWPQEVLSANLHLVSAGVNANLLELNEGYRDHEAIRDTDGHRVTVAEKARVEVSIFPGQNSKVVIVEGGVHGNEPRGLEVCEQVIDDLTKLPPGTKPFYTVVIIRSIFPDTTAAKKRHVNKSDGLPYPSEKLSACDNDTIADPRKCIGTNRNFPGKTKDEAIEVVDDKGKKTTTTITKVEEAHSLSESMAADGFYRDANGEKILPETAALTKLTEQLKPERLISLHGARRERAMFAVDKINPSNPVLDAENEKLALEAADSVRDAVGRDSVQGNKCTSSSCAGGTALWAGEKAVGISTGGYMSTATSARPPISTFTVEIDNRTNVDKTINKKEIKAYADAIRTIMFK